MTPARIMISTASSPRTQGLWRSDSIGGLNYAEAISQTGGLPFFVPNLNPELAAAYLANADGLVLSGGGDIDPGYFGQPPHTDLGLVNEDRDLFELALYRAAKAKGIPILGICRGIQVINVAEGGTLHQHLPARPNTLQHSQKNKDGTPFHTVKLESSSMLAKHYGSETIRTNSYHHQAIDKLGTELKASAWAEDGTIEAVEGIGKTFGKTFVLGVQWHPEMSFARYPEHLAPFRTFMERVDLGLAQQRTPSLSL